MTVDPWLRRMLSDASDLQLSLELGRWVATTRLRRRSWKVMLGPDFEARALVVVTACLADR